MATALSTLKWGEYYPTPNNTPGTFQARQYSIGRQFDNASWFISFDSTPTTHTEFKTLSDAGATTLVAWQPSRTTPFALSDILAGTYDAHINSWADYFFTFSHPVVIRWGHEFNGTFMAWNPCYTSGNSAVISGVSATGSANTTVTTTAAHNLTNGQTVMFYNVGGATSLNSGNYNVTVVDATNFTIALVNSTAWTSGGTLKWSKTTLNVGQYISAWQYMVNKVAARATATSVTNNVKWYWCANANDAPSTSPNLESFWPGNSYVDYVGYDNYNTLNGLYMTPLQTIQGFTNNSQANTYDRVTAVATNSQPVWIGELNCVDVNDSKDTTNTAVGHSKGTWYSQLFAQDLTAVPRLGAINFFDSPGTRNTWPMDSTTAAFSSFVSSFVTGTYTPAPAPTIVAGTPSPWTGYQLPGPEVHVPTLLSNGTVNPIARSLGGEISAIWHHLNTLLTKVSGWYSLTANSDGTVPAGTFVGNAQGTIAVPVLRIQTNSTSLKAMLALLVSGDTIPVLQINQDGSMRWSVGGTTADDTRLYRSGIGSLTTDTNFTAGGNITGANIITPVSKNTNSGSAPTRPLSGNGINVFAQADGAYLGLVGKNVQIRPGLEQIHLRAANTVSPEAASSAITLTSGTVYLGRLGVFDTRTVTSIGCYVINAGATLTGCYLGLYDTAGNLLGQSADLSTTFTTTGEKRVTLTAVGSLAISAGTYLFAALLIGTATTSPIFAGVSTNTLNWNVTGSAARSLSFGSGQTTLPTTITIGSTGTQNKLTFIDLN